LIDQSNTFYRVELSRPRIEFSHQTKTVFVGGLEDGIDDAELKKYFSEFGFVTRALRIPNKDGPKRKFGKFSKLRLKSTDPV
jgi:RNA recognition motif-containing protein